MKHNDPSLTRRGFLHASGVLGIGAIVASSPLGAAASASPRVPVRKFGRSGIEVPMLGLGGIFDTENNQHVLRLAFNHGVRYWDTAEGYENGGSERGMGNFISRNSALRKELFLVTKASRGSARTAAGLTAALAESLGRLKTDYVDLYFVHGISAIDQIDRPEIRTWVEEAKRSGKIRLFGFSCHSEMASCVLGASRLGWVDGAMITYNFRLMDAPEMKRALEAAHAAGLGLTAMKTMAHRSRRGGTSVAAADKLLDPIRAKGFSQEQAALKAVWESAAFASICSQMANTDILAANVAASLDRASLAADGREALQKYAAATCSGYCAGCRHHCEGALGGAVPVQTVMRRLMYHHHYEPAFDPESSRAGIPENLRLRLAGIDYSAAERACPHKLPIGDMMREAGRILA